IRSDFSRHRHDDCRVICATCTFLRFLDGVCSRFTAACFRRRLRRDAGGCNTDRHSWTAAETMRLLALFTASLLLGTAPGQPPARRPDVHFAATPQHVADAMLKLAHVTAADVVYDLGSGDGRIVILAAQK